MNGNIHPIGVREFIFKYLQDDKIFDFLPEFDFLKELSAKWKAQNCSCGLGAQINEATQKYNILVESLNPEVAAKVGIVFGLSEVCFSVQSQGAHTVKCF